MLRSLLLSRDDGTIRIVARCFRELEVGLDHCPDAKLAIQKAAESRYHAVVVDDQIEDARVVLEKLLDLPSCNKSVRIALADPSVKMDSVFKSGTQIILYKPLSADRVRHGLRAVRNLMARESRRGAKRVHTVIPAKLSQKQSRGAAKPVLIVDLSESGAAIKSEMDLAASDIFHLDFALSKNSERVRATAELVWHNNEGAAGLRFVDMSSQGRKQLGDWLKESVALEKPQSATGARAGR